MPRRERAAPRSGRSPRTRRAHRGRGAPRGRSARRRRRRCRPAACRAGAIRSSGPAIPPSAGHATASGSNGSVARAGPARSASSRARMNRHLRTRVRRAQPGWPGASTTRSRRPCAAAASSAAAAHRAWPRTARAHAAWFPSPASAFLYARTASFSHPRAPPGTPPRGDGQRSGARPAGGAGSALHRRQGLLRKHPARMRVLIASMSPGDGRRGNDRVDSAWELRLGRASAGFAERAPRTPPPPQRPSAPVGRRERRHPAAGPAPGGAPRPARRGGRGGRGPRPRRPPRVSAARRRPPARPTRLVVRSARRGRCPSHSYS